MTARMIFAVVLNDLLSNLILKCASKIGARSDRLHGEFKKGVLY